MDGKINSCVSHQKGIKRKDHFLLKAKDSPIANAAAEVACPDGNEYPFFERLPA